jgi:hypothetical protein
MFTVFPSRLVGAREIIGKSGEVLNPELVSGSEIPKQVRNKIEPFRRCRATVKIGQWSIVIGKILKHQ